MIRNIALWLMYFYADDGRPMPNWLRRWIDSNPKLGEHARRYANLEQQLRISASERLGQTPHDPIAIPSSTIRDRHHSNHSTAGWLALAASLLLLITGGVVVTYRTGGWWSNRPSAQEVAAKNPVEGLKLSEETRKRIQVSALAAKEWMDRSIKKSETTPAIAMAALDIKLNDELSTIRDQLGDATRFFAVKLPIAGSKLLGAIP